VFVLMTRAPCRHQGTVLSFVVLIACPGPVAAAKGWQVAAIAGPGDGWQTGRVTDEQTSTVRGDAEFIARAGHLFDAVHEEFVLAARDLSTWSQPEIRSAIARRVHSPGKDGVTVRKMWSPLVLADEAQRAHLLRLGTAGTHVRISSAPLPHETMILDRRVAILAGQPSPAGREYTVTTSPVLVSGVYSLLSAAWEAAIDLDACLRGEVPELAPEAREVLRALGAGLTDEAAARRLGTSLRTYRRRVAELMAALEAGSRFQAGVRAGELGLAR
jgi:DNA-binding NarL/FixJ family response regulator